MIAKSKYESTHTLIITKFLIQLCMFRKSCHTFVYGVMRKAGFLLGIAGVGGSWRFGRLGRFVLSWR